MARKYYIVEHRGTDFRGNEEVHFSAHKGVKARFGVFDIWNMVSDCSAFTPEECEKRLRFKLKKVRPKLVKVLTI